MGREEVGCACGVGKRAPWEGEGVQAGWPGEWSTTRRGNPDRRVQILCGERRAQEAWAVGEEGVLCVIWKW